VSRSFLALALLVALSGCGATTRAPSVAPPPGPYSLVEVATGRPDAVVDLSDDASAALVAARWRHAPVSLVEVEGVDPGPDARPVPSSASRTMDLSLAPRGAGWDAAAWEPFEPHDLGARRGHGHLSMGWVRIELVLPERIGDLEIRGATVAFEITADDYGEVWVNGRLPHRVGDRGGAVVAGWNAPNRVVLTTSAEPGMRFDVAVLVVNGPISRSPGNFYWVRQAMLDVHATSTRTSGPTVPFERSGPERESLAPADAALEVVAMGFERLGPIVWIPDERSFLLSDVAADTLYRFVPETGALSVVQTHVGGHPQDLGRRTAVGITALGLDPNGLLLACRAGRMDVVRYERSGAITVVPDLDRVGFQRLHWAHARAPLPGQPAVHDVELRGGESSSRASDTQRWLATDRGVVVMREADIVARFETPMPIRGLAFGDDVLYMTTGDSLLRLRGPAADR